MNTRLQSQAVQTNARSSGDGRLESNYFDLFALSPAFALDPKSLDRAYRSIQSRVHPDKFVSAGHTEQRQAAQWAALANEAYQTLKHALPRARYLIQLNGVNPDACAVPTSFLMTQMELRESVQQARSTRNRSALFELSVELHREVNALLGQLAQQLDTEHDFVAAAQSTQKLQFFTKLAADLDDAMEVAEA